MRGLLQWVFVAAVLWSAWNSWRLRDFPQPPGVLVPEDPQQVALEGPPKIFRKGDYEMQALASYKIRGRLLHRERYRFDASSGISPLDFGLGWGPMSDTTVLEQIEFTQSARFLTWRWEGAGPLPFEVLNSHASNSHLIPADGGVFAALNRMRTGQVVELDGYLVKVTGPKGFTWSGSLSRTDVGAGACEVFYVQHARVI